MAPCFVLIACSFTLFFKVNYVQFENDDPDLGIDSSSSRKNRTPRRDSSTITNLNNKDTKVNTQEENVAKTEKDQ